MSSEAAAYFPDGLANTAEVYEASPGKTSSLREAAAKQSAAEPTDDQLLLQVGLGSKDALGVLYRRIAPSIFHVALRILKDEAEAEDLVHEVFLFLFSKATQFDPGKGTARSWIIQATYHRAFDRKSFLSVRHHYKMKEPHDDLHSVRCRDVEQMAVDGIMAQELLARFREVLKPDQRRVLELHFFGGFSFREIAEQTGQTLENTRKLYLRGRLRLRADVFRQKETTK